jgi:uncharacterized membrane protein YqgA involved in biofilm formation
MIGTELHSAAVLAAAVPIRGTLINVAAVLAGTAIGVAVGGRLPPGLQQRVLAGLGLVTGVVGIDLALAWRDTSPLYVLGAVLLGGLVGEALDIEGRLSRLGDRLQARMQRAGETSTISEGFFTASLLFCVGPLTVIGSFEDGLRGNLEPLATKSMLDGFASIALASTLGVGVAFAAITVLLVQGALTLGAGLFDGLLQGEALDAMTSTGGVLIMGISLKLLDLKDVKVGNFLPALVLAPLLVGLVGRVSLLS